MAHIFVITIYNFHNISDTLLWPVTYYAGNNGRHYPNAFLNIRNGTVMYLVPSAHTFQVQMGQSSLDIINDKSRKREIRVLVTSIEQLSTRYDSTHYSCNKLNL